jgi:hypothetical protein
MVDGGWTHNFLWVVKKSGNRNCLIVKRPVDRVMLFIAYISKV